VILVENMHVQSGLAKRDDCLVLRGSLLGPEERMYITTMSRIQVSPDIHFGKPCVAGTRIPVQAVLELVREAIPFEVIIRDYYCELKLEDIKACLQYAIDVVQTEDIHLSVAS
jgi:uncharacterized protein (DUF433 family)